CRHKEPRNNPPPNSTPATAPRSTPARAPRTSPPPSGPRHSAGWPPPRSSGSPRCGPTAGCTYTPCIAAWHDGALYFSTGREEQKAKNLARHAHCALTTGANSLTEGLDLVVEGRAEPVTDPSLLEGGDPRRTRTGSTATRVGRS
ncbi:LOW QUALITY PROTEIN: conserved hypothetical protein, partial [Streptomyces viridochromogenes DSM 40736]